MTEVAFEYPTEEHVTHIWNNLREADKVELAVDGMTAENAFQYISHWNEAQCGLADGEPVAIFGYTQTAATIRFNFFCTPRADSFWKTITKTAKSYIKWNVRNFPQLRPVIEVWEGHTQSLRWLKHLGFKPTGAFRYTPHGKLIFVEYDKYKERY